MTRPVDPARGRCSRRAWLTASAVALLGGCGRGTGAAGHLPARRGGRGPFRTAWVFSSGGPRGFVHVGMAMGLLRLGLRPDLVMGASIGAVVACLVAARLPAERLESLALEIGMLDAVRPVLGPPWLDAGGLIDWLRGTVEARELQQLPTPCAVVAADAETREPLVFDHGDIGLAVQASCAIEGRFAPVRLGNRRAMDADLVMPLPVHAARELGAVRVLAMDASAHEWNAPPGTEKWRPGDLRKRALTEPDARAADLLLHPDSDYYAGFSADYRRHAMGVGAAFVQARAAELRQFHARAAGATP